MAVRQKRLIDFEYKGRSIQIITDSHGKWRSVYVDGRWRFQSDKRMTDAKAIESIKQILEWEPE